ncbi:ceramide kinase [Andrographis paniculata]|uniref:ceramide kinase n=1 Tax=Andrographis paniculata TaxID=175694 RepID=UPI0021E71534|nr:ceramide kinase [Andrographis paniculata]
MDRIENGAMRDHAAPNSPFSDRHKGSVFSCNFVLDRVGEVVLTHNSHGLSWRLVDSFPNGEERVHCLGLKLVANSDAEVNFSDISAVNFIGWGLIHESSIGSGDRSLLAHSYEMYRFTVHAVGKSKSQSSLWIPSVYTFGHKDLETCKTWVNRINSALSEGAERPKNLLVFVHPKSGKGHGCKVWESVAPLFTQSKVNTKVIVTERAGHARDTLTSITNRDLASYDGVIAVGGDGFFSEILNGILLSRHKAPYPPAPENPMHSVERDKNASPKDGERSNLESQNHNEDESPLLTGSENIDPKSPISEEGLEFSFPNEKFRFGIIPAGSTDAIAICTTGARDPVTSALHIILGKKVQLDIAQLVRWRKKRGSKEESSVRYAASFAGYGFYGDVITESEKYRWMGPKRYDYAGTKVFLKHKSYEAEVNYLESESMGQSSSGLDIDEQITSRWCLPRKPDRVSCRANCEVCSAKSDRTAAVGTPSTAGNLQGRKWSRTKGRFLSVGAAVISCRNEKAPDGLVADAHLSDGYLHLILVKDCPHPFYLWHLIQLARRGGDPLDFNFVEHHKTPAFTFMSIGEEGVWNVDGELFRAHRLSAQVFRGLVSVFATGPQE